MRAHEHVNAPPPGGIGNRLTRKICTTALALVTVIAWATSASAQAEPDRAASIVINLWQPQFQFNNTELETSNTPVSGELVSDLYFEPVLPVRLTQDVDPNAPPPTGPSQGSSSALSASELAKEISNPVTSLWQLQFQFNNIQLETSNTPVSGEWVNNLYFQPVLPVSLTENFNLITRPVITLYNSVPVPTGPFSSEQNTEFGDTILASVLSPAGTEPWIFAIGPTFIFPTAGSDETGQGKWQVGPAIGGGYITDKFMIAAFAQQWWSFDGDEDRESTSQLNLLPLMYRFFGDGWSVGYSGNIVADWRAPSDERWTVPLGLSLGKVVRFGRLPVQVQIAGQYFVERPTGGPEWNIQLQVTPVIPRLINEVLFH